MGVEDERAVLERGTASLLCEPPGPNEGEVCPTLLRSSRRKYVLGVSYGDTPDEWHARVQNAPAREVGIITVDGVTRSATTDFGNGSGVTVVDDPSDLVGLTVAIDRYLDRYERVALCFDSVTAMLAHVSTERAYKFLNALTERLWRANADSHFHFHPAAHDRQTVQHVASLFDDRVEPGDAR